MHVHCLSTKLGQNPDFEKSAIAMSISTKTSDRGDFRDLDAECASIDHASDWWSYQKGIGRKSAKKVPILEIFALA